MASSRVIKSWGIVPTGTTPSWDYWLVPQKLMFKVSERSELNWQRYRELPQMVPLRHGVVPTGTSPTFDYWLVPQKLQRYREVPQMTPLRHGVVTTLKYTSWDYWFIPQKLKFKVS